MRKNKILFICMGNICRSPSAEAVFAAQLAKAGLQDEFIIDSAGTHAYHIGHSPDKRSVAAALKRGIDMQHLRARQVEAADFEKFDRLIVMDRANLMEIKSRFPDANHQKMSLMMSYAYDRVETEVPDPYYGDGDGFELVLDLLADASIGLLSEYKDSSDYS
ncbi:low molecular weight protein-tyrosine-phosphatase [Marinicella gelatinilytica]|uniref:low molecular weight protein-tyrosine-phosphatase n=1 Tax=Marinicella gelatinilytica TaxID=2996017 RepID=UPI002260E983|nr:low molecular weight protein-tyrosine-phosphatase [Marinicella gelatinilytica]MCX7544811.1 low molecular weight phosphotyrosine protein phosphatase [Marinicella gelatinilytica]